MNRYPALSRKNHFIQLTSILLALSVLWGAVVPTFAEASVWAERQHALKNLGNSGQERKSNPLLASLKSLEPQNSFLNIPENLGQVVETYIPAGVSTNTPLIVHIQDAHGHYAAQKNLSAILEKVQGVVGSNNKGEMPVLVEGAWKEVHPEWLAALPESGKKSLIEKLLQEGLITGEEYWAAQRGIQPEIQGIEDREVYESNMKSRRLMDSERSEILAKIEGLRLRMERVKARTYPERLYAFEKNAEKFESGKLDFIRYLAALKAASPSSFSNGRFPEISKIQSWMENHPEVVPARVEKERAEVIAALSRKLSREELAAFAQSTLHFRLGKIGAQLYYGSLLDLAKKFRIGAPELARYAEHIRFTQSITFETCQLEISELEDEYRRVAAGADSRVRQAVRYDRLLNLQAKFWDEKISPRHWESYLALDDEDKTRPFIQIERFLGDAERFLKLSPEGSAPRQSLAQSSSEAQLSFQEKRFLQEAYYRLAFKRDRILAENALALISTDSVEKAALIAGGFHTEGITRIFREKKIPFVVIRPSLGSDTSAKDSASGLSPDEFERWKRDYAERLESLKTGGDEDREIDELIKTVLERIRWEGPFEGSSGKYWTGSFAGPKTRLKFVAENQDSDDSPVALGRFEDGLKAAYGTLRVETNLSSPERAARLQIEMQSQVLAPGFHMRLIEDRPEPEQAESDAQVETIKNPRTQAAFSVKARERKKGERQRPRLEIRHQEYFRALWNQVRRDFPDAKLPEDLKYRIFEGMSSLARHYDGIIDLDSRMLPSNNDRPKVKEGKRTAALLALLHEGIHAQIDESLSVHQDETSPESRLAEEILATQKEFEYFLSFGEEDRTAYLEYFLLQTRSLSARAYVNLFRDLRKMYRVFEDNQSAQDKREGLQVIHIRIADYLLNMDAQSRKHQFKGIRMGRRTSQKVFARLNEMSQAIDQVRPSLGDVLESGFSLDGLDEFRSMGFEPSTGSRSRQPVAQWRELGLASHIPGAILVNPESERTTSMFQLDRTQVTDHNVVILVDLGTKDDSNAYQRMALRLTGDGSIGAVIPQIKIEPIHAKGLYNVLILKPFMVMYLVLPFVILYYPAVAIVLALSMLVYFGREFKGGLETIQSREYLINSWIRTITTKIRKDSSLALVGSIQADAKTTVESLLKQRARWLGEISRVLGDVVARRYPINEVFSPFTDWFNARRTHGRFSDPNEGTGWLEDPRIPGWLKTYESAIAPGQISYIEGGAARIVDLYQEGYVTSDDILLGGRPVGEVIIVIQPDGAMIVTRTGLKVHVVMSPRLTKGQKFNTALQLWQGRMALDLDGVRYSGEKIADFPAGQGKRATFWTPYPSEISNAEKIANDEIRRKKSAALRAYHSANLVDETSNVAVGPIQIPAGPVGQVFSPSRIDSFLSNITFGKLDWLIFMRYQFYFGTLLRKQKVYSTLFGSYQPREVLKKVTAAVISGENRGELERTRLHRYEEIYHQLIALAGSEEALAELLGIGDVENRTQLLLIAIGLMSETGNDMAVGEPLADRMATGNIDSHYMGDAVKPFGWIGDREEGIFRRASESFPGYGQDSSWLWASPQSLKQGGLRISAYTFMPPGEGLARTIGEKNVRAALGALQSAQERGYSVDEIRFSIHPEGGICAIVIAPSAAHSDALKGNIDWDKTSSSLENKTLYADRVEQYLAGYASPIPDSLRFIILTPEEFRIISEGIHDPALEATAKVMGVPGFRIEGSRQDREMIVGSEQFGSIKRADPSVVYVAQKLEAKRSGNEYPTFDQWAILNSRLEPTADQISATYARLSREWVRKLNVRLRSQGSRTLSKHAERTGRIRVGSRDMELLVGAFGEPGQTVDFSDVTRWHMVFGRIFDAPFIGTVRIPFARPFFRKLPEVSALVARQRIAEGSQSSCLGPSVLPIEYVGLVEDFRTGTRLGELAPIPPASGGLKEWTFEITRRNVMPPVLEALQLLQYEGIQRSFHSLKTHHLDSDIIRDLGILELAENIYALSGSSPMPQRGKHSLGLFEHGFFSGTWQDARNGVPGLFFHGSYLSYKEGMKYYEGIPNFSLAVKLLRIYFGDPDARMAVNPRAAVAIALNYTRDEIQAETVRLESRYRELAALPSEVQTLVAQPARKLSISRALSDLPSNVAQGVLTYLAQLPKGDTPSHEIQEVLEFTKAHLEENPESNLMLADAYSLAQKTKAKPEHLLQALTSLNLHGSGLTRPHAVKALEYELFRARMADIKPDPLFVQRSRRFFMDAIGWGAIVYMGSYLLYRLMFEDMTIVSTVLGIVSIASFGLIGLWVVINAVVEFTPLGVLIGYHVGTAVGMSIAWVKVAFQIARIRFRLWRFREFNLMNGRSSEPERRESPVQEATVHAQARLDLMDIIRLHRSISSKPVVPAKMEGRPAATVLDGRSKMEGGGFVFQLGKMHSGNRTQYHYPTILIRLNAVMSRISALHRLRNPGLLKDQVIITFGSRTSFDFLRFLDPSSGENVSELPMELLEERNSAQLEGNQILLSLLMSVGMIPQNYGPSDDFMQAYASRLRLLQDHFLSLSAIEQGLVLDALQRLERQYDADSVPFQPIYYLLNVSLIYKPAEAPNFNAIGALLENSGIFPAVGSSQAAPRARSFMLIEDGLPDQGTGKDVQIIQLKLRVPFLQSVKEGIFKGAQTLRQKPSWSGALFAVAIFSLLGLSVFLYDPFSIGVTMAYTDEAVYATQHLIQMSDPNTFVWPNHHAGLPFFWPAISSYLYAFGGIALSRSVIFLTSLITLYPIFQYSRLAIERLGARNGRWPALAATFIFTILPATILTASFASYDRPAILMLAASLWMLELGIKRNSRRHYLLSALALTASFGFKYLGMAVFPYMLAYPVVAAVSAVGVGKLMGRARRASWSPESLGRNLALFLRQPYIRYYIIPFLMLFVVTIASVHEIFFGYLFNIVLAKSSSANMSDVLLTFVKFYFPAFILSLIGFIFSRSKLQAAFILLGSAFFLIVSPKMSFDKQFIYVATIAVPLFGTIFSNWGSRRWLSVPFRTLKLAVFSIFALSILYINGSMGSYLNNRWWNDVRPAYSAMNQALKPGDRVLTTQGESIFIEMRPDIQHTISVHHWQYANYQGKLHVRAEQSEYQRIKSGYYQVVIYNSNPFPIDSSIMNHLLRGADSKYDLVYYEEDTTLGVYVLKDENRPSVPAMDRHANLTKNFAKPVDTFLRNIRITTLIIATGVFMSAALLYLLRFRVYLQWLIVRSYMGEKRAREYESYSLLESRFRLAGYDFERIPLSARIRLVNAVSNSSQMPLIHVALDPQPNVTRGEALTRFETTYELLRIRLRHLNSAVKGAVAVTLMNLGDLAYRTLDSIRMHFRTYAPHYYRGLAIYTIVIMLSLINSSSIVDRVYGKQEQELEKIGNFQIERVLQTQDRAYDQEKVDFRMARVYRLGPGRVLVHSEGRTAPPLLQRDADGLVTLSVPKSWRSGVYMAQSPSGKGDRFHFTVPQKVPGSLSRTAVFLSPDLFHGISNIWENGETSLGEEIIQSLEEAGVAIEYVDNLATVNDMDIPAYDRIIVAGVSGEVAKDQLKSFIKRGGEVIQINNPQSAAAVIDNYLQKFRSDLPLVIPVQSIAEAQNDGGGASVKVSQDSESGRSYLQLHSPARWGANSFANGIEYPSRGSKSYLQAAIGRFRTLVRSERDFIFYVQVRLNDGTPDGKKVVLHYNSKKRIPSNPLEFVTGNYGTEFNRTFIVHDTEYAVFNLGEEMKNGEWQELDRNIQNDIETAFGPNVTLRYVEAFQAVGTLDLGDIELLSPLSPDFRSARELSSQHARGDVEIIGTSADISPDSPEYDVPNASKLTPNEDTNKFGLTAPLIKVPFKALPSTYGIEQQIIVSTNKIGTLDPKTLAGKPFRVLSAQNNRIVWRGNLPMSGTDEPLSGEYLFDIRISLENAGEYKVVVMVGSDWYSSSSFQVTDNIAGPEARLLADSFQSRRTGNYPDLIRDVSFAADTFAPGKTMKMPHSQFDEGNVWFFVPLHSKFVNQTVSSIRHMPFPERMAEPLVDQAIYLFDWMYEMQAHSGPLMGSVAELESSGALKGYDSLKKINARTVHGGGLRNFSSTTVAAHSAAMGNYYQIFRERPDSAEHMRKALSAQIQGFYFLDVYYQSHSKQPIWDNKISKLEQGGYYKDTRDIDERMLSAIMLLESYHANPMLFGQLSYESGIDIDVDAVADFIRRNYSQMKIKDFPGNETTNKDMLVAMEISNFDDTIAARFGFEGLRESAQKDILSYGDSLVQLARTPGLRGLAADKQAQEVWGSNMRFAENGLDLLRAYFTRARLLHNESDGNILREAIEIWTYLALGGNEYGVSFISDTRNGPKNISDVLTKLYPKGKPGLMVLGSAAHSKPKESPGTKYYVDRLDRKNPWVNLEPSLELQSPAAGFGALLVAASEHRYSAISQSETSWKQSAGILAEHLGQGYTEKTDAQKALMIQIFNGETVTYNGRTYQGRMGDFDPVYLFLYEQFVAVPRISLTFDDGFKEWLDFAAPEMQKRGISGTGYIFTNGIGRNDHLSYDQIRRLNKEYGWEIGSHSVSHPSSLKDMDPDSILSEVKRSKDQLESVGLDVTSFASPGHSYSPQIVEFLAKYYPIARFGDFEIRHMDSGLRNRPVGNNYYVVTKVITDDTKPQEVQEAIDNAIKNRSWLILLFHKFPDDRDAHYDTEMNRESFIETLDIIAANGIRSVTVTEGAQAAAQNLPNLVSNPSFERRDSDGWVRSWRIQGGKDGISIDSSGMGNFPAPTTSIRFAGGESARAIASELIPVAAGGRYGFRSFVNIKNASEGSFDVRVNEFDSEKKLIRSKKIVSLKDPVTGHIVREFYADNQDATYISLEIGLAPQSAMQVYIDTVEVLPLGAPQSSPAGSFPISADGDKGGLVPSISTWLRSYDVDGLKRILAVQPAAEWLAYDVMAGLFGASLISLTLLASGQPVEWQALLQSYSLSSAAAKLPFLSAHRGTRDLWVPAQIVSAFSLVSSALLFAGIPAAGAAFAFVLPLLAHVAVNAAFNLSQIRSAVRAKAAQIFSGNFAPRFMTQSISQGPREGIRSIATTLDVPAPRVPQAVKLIRALRQLSGSRAADIALSGQGSLKAVILDLRDLPIQGETVRLSPLEEAVIRMAVENVQTLRAAEPAGAQNPRSGIVLMSRQNENDALRSAAALGIPKEFVLIVQGESAGVERWMKSRAASLIGMLTSSQDLKDLYEKLFGGSGWFIFLNRLTDVQVEFVLQGPMARNFYGLLQKSGLESLDKFVEYGEDGSGNPTLRLKAREMEVPGLDDSLERTRAVNISA